MEKIKIRHKCNNTSLFKKKKITYIYIILYNYLLIYLTIT